MSSSVIGALRVTLGLDSAEFTRGTKKAQAQATAMQKSMSGLTSGIKTYGAALIGGGIVAGLGAIASNAFEMGSALSEAASKVGVTVEALQEMRYVAEQNGVAVDTMEGSLNKMTKTLGELQLQNPAVAKTFKQLGLSAREMVGLTPTESFTKIADALGKIEDETQRAALGNKIFGRSYAELKPIIDLGAEGIRSAAEEKRKDGVISTEQAKKLDDLADGWERLKGKLGTAAAQFIANRTASADASEGLDRMGDSVAALTQDFEKLFGWMDRLVTKFHEMQRALAVRVRDSALTSWIPGASDDAQKKINILDDVIRKRNGSAPGFNNRSRKLPGVGNKRSGANFAGGGLNAVLGLTGFGDMDAGAGTGIDIKNLFDKAEAEVADFGEKWEDATDKGIDSNAEFKRSTEDTLRDVSSSLSSFANSIKSGDFFSIFDSVIGLLGSIGQATGGFNLGPLQFPGASGSSGSIPGFANGGAMKLGGIGGIDRNVISMNGRPLLRASRGETLQIKPQNDGGASGGVVRVMVETNDYLDTRIVGQASRVVLASAEPIASLGSNMAQRNMMKRGSRRLA